jgi:uncharacterized OB-fold protein
MGRRLPSPTELSRGFWDAAADHRLVIPCCPECETRFFPPERLCPTCGTAGWGYVDTSGAATITSYTVVHRAPSPDFETPYVLAVVALDGGGRMLTNIVGADPAAIATGMPVRVVFLDQPDDRALPVFEPTTGGRPHEPEKE